MTGDWTSGNGAGASDEDAPAPGDRAGSCIALVPVKPLAEAKSRLAGALSAPARKELATSLALRTLDVLSGAPGVNLVAVVSRDPLVAAMARARGAEPLLEYGSRLDEIIDRALAELEARGATSALVVLADLPHLRAEDVVAMLELGERHEVVLAPDERDEGTNAILLSPPSRMPTCFGRRGSFGAHMERAVSMGIDAAVLRAPGLAFDLDAAHDLLRLPGKIGPY